MLNVLVNRRSCSLPDGLSLLQALRVAGVPLPALCHDDRLTPSGACRLCLVRVNGAAQAVPACTTPLADGMTIETDTPELEAARRTTLELLALDYPGEAVRNFPDKDFHRELRARGIEAGRPATAPGTATDTSHPYIAVDMSRCIDCYRCVRICDELQGQSVWHIRGRGADTVIQPDGPTLLESSCVGCGACVDACPTGALEDAASVALGAAERWTRTTCPYCGVGCELNVGTRGDRIVSVRPVMDAPVSKGHLCVKGRYAYSFVDAGDRILEPMIRTREGWRPTSWDTALAFTADRLRTLIVEHGPDSIGVLGSARGTNEDAYIAQKFARLAIGTNNVDCCARVCHAPSAAALKGALGTGLATGSFDDIERARTILVCGANPTENHPVVGARIKQAARRGARLIVIDPRQIELAAYADCHLAPRPGTNIALLNAMAHTIVSEQLCDSAFLERRVAGLSAYAERVHDWPAERAARTCGIAAADIRRAARLYATGAPAMAFHGLGVTEHVQGTDGVTALINLALLTGNIGRPGTGVNPLRGQNNVQGAAHMGCDPRLLPGSTPLEQGRSSFEQAWRAVLPHTAGLDVMTMMDAAEAGRLKGLWAIGYDVFFTNPNAATTARALGALDLVIVQDLFLTETAREFGTVFLPAGSSFEKDGTFMNAERRIQRVRKAFDPRGGSRPDWQIMCGVAHAMGWQDGFTFAQPEAIWNEIRMLCGGARGMTYARLDAGGLQWPCPSEDHPGTALLHQTTFGGRDRAELRWMDWAPSPEQVDEEFPLLLTTGRTLYQFNAGTMTGRTPNATLRPTDLVDVSEEDAHRLALRDGERVRLVSHYGSAVLPARRNAAVAAGQLFATFHAAEVFLNRLTGPHRDAVTNTPAYKMVAVRIERLEPP